MWFETLTGFREESPQMVRENLKVQGNVLQSLVNGKSWVCGRLETPTLGELRERVSRIEADAGPIKVREVVANVQQLHTDTANAGAMFQVASQFNLLEMVSPDITPERGVGIYERDRTQGPACAIAAGAGTIYRNYFASVDGHIGQSADHQLDCLADLGSALGNTQDRLWQMKNGYALATRAGLEEISQRLHAASDAARDELRALLRIGLQWETQVTLEASQHTVSQAYCSALPVAYSHHPSSLWEKFAVLVLEGAYEATICAAILNSRKAGSNRVFLTMLGGGAFGNESDWILHGLRRAIRLYDQSNLDIAIVSYGASRPEVQRLIRDLGGN